MLTRTCRVGRLLAASPRLYSTSPYKDIPKLRAFPFRLSPEDARRQMAIFGAMLSSELNLSTVLSSFMANFSNTANYKPPTRFVATYFPAWIINGEVEMDITYKSLKTPASSILFKNTYIPGSHVPTLSAASLWPRALDDKDAAEPLPFDESLLEQHELEIQCIPFTVSPFSLLEVAKTSSTLSYGSELSFTPSSINSRIISASPILLPLYLAQYESPQTGFFTTFIQAHASGDTQPVMMETRALDVIRVGGLARFTDKIFDVDQEVIEIPPMGEPRLNGKIPMLRHSDCDVDEVFKFFDGKLAYSSNIAGLASRSNLASDLKDFRIREMTPEELREMHSYLEITHESRAFKYQIGETLLGESAALDKSFKKVQEIEEGAIPTWWSEYQKRLSSKTQSTPP